MYATTASIRSRVSRQGRRYNSYFDAWLSPDQYRSRLYNLTDSQLWNYGQSGHHIGRSSGPSVHSRYIRLYDQFLDQGHERYIRTRRVSQYALDDDQNVIDNPNFVKYPH